MLLCVTEKPEKQGAYVCQHMYEHKSPKRVLKDVALVLPWLWQLRSIGDDDKSGTTQIPPHYLLMVPVPEASGIHLYLKAQVESAPRYPHFRHRSQHSRPRHCESQCQNAPQPCLLPRTLAPSHPKQQAFIQEPKLPT